MQGELEQVSQMEQAGLQTLQLVLFLQQESVHGQLERVLPVQAARSQVAGQIEEVESKTGPTPM